MKNLIAISAPSGTGKSTLCEEIRIKKPEIKFSISCTTRPRRDYEIDGINYYFLTDVEFMEKVKNNELLEYEEVHGYYYGTLSNTLNNAISSKELMLFDVDVNGAMSIKKIYPNNTLTVFILPPSIEDNSIPASSLCRSTANSKSGVVLLPSLIARPKVR